VLAKRWLILYSEGGRGAEMDMIIVAGVGLAVCISYIVWQY
jgi:hypothetical protein